jgi:acyl-homoserine lactone synthase
MFEARKQVFVDLLKWDVPVLEGRYEIDQFDDEHARYLILTDRAGRHLASTRLLPTSRPHILDSFYASLCEGTPPRSPRIFEITRFCLDRRIGASRRRQARDLLVTTLVRFALANEIERYTAIAEVAWLQQILAFGWRCMPLGLPKKIGGVALGAVAMEIDHETPQRLRGAGISDAEVEEEDTRHAA